MFREFSWQTDLFLPMILLSVLGHVVILAVTSPFSRNPQFSIQQAEYSMDIVLLEERQPVPERLLPVEEIIREANVPEPDKEEIPKPLPQQETQDNLSSLEMQGAVVEAKAAEATNKAPVYPMRARRQGWQGRVVIKAFVEANGLPSCVEIEKTSGYRVLDEAALSAIEQWKFYPAQRGADAFPSWVRIPVRFKLIDN